MWFSPAGGSLAFLKFDESKVKEYSYSLYEKKTDNPYPETVVVKYPKAIIDMLLCNY